MLLHWRRSSCGFLGGFDVVEHVFSFSVGVVRPHFVLSGMVESPMIEGLGRHLLFGENLILPVVLLAGLVVGFFELTRVSCCGPPVGALVLLGMVSFHMIPYPCPCFAPFGKRLP